MAFRLYKEGQGTWARGTLACTVGIGGLLAAMSTFERLSGTAWAQEPWFTLPFFHWVVKADMILAMLVVVPFAVLGVWLYNHPRLSDFLIETEGELKTKVTWPTRKEATNNSIVVIITCIVMGLWVFLADSVVGYLSEILYSIQSG